jgi:hypothetical protein
VGYLKLILRKVSVTPDVGYVHFDLDNSFIVRKSQLLFTPAKHTSSSSEGSQPILYSPTSSHLMSCHLKLQSPIYSPFNLSCVTLNAVSSNSFSSFV